MKRTCSLLSFLLLFLIFSWQNACAAKGCLHLTLEKKVDAPGHVLLFTVKNIGEDAIFEEKDKLPWQAGKEIFSLRMISQSDPQVELEDSYEKKEISGMVAMFPRDYLKEEVLVEKRFRDFSEILEGDDLLLLWRYKPGPECAEQKGTIKFEKSN